MKEHSMKGVNLAAIWKLPVIFIAENNGYGEATTFEYASSCDSIADRAKSLQYSRCSSGWKRSASCI